MAFDWDTQGPCGLAAIALDRLLITRVDPEAEFPMTYSGQTWRYAFRLWKATAEYPDLLDGLDVYAKVPGVECDDLELTGFMEGWARNAVRQMRGKLPKANPAIVTVGAGEHDQMTASVESPEAQLRRVLGG